MRPFEVELPWEIGRSLWLLIVTGMYRPPRAARRRGHPDTWTQAEHGIMEDVVVMNANRHNVSKALTDELLKDESFVEEVLTKIERGIG